jgi:hypothetical protein
VTALASKFSDADLTTQLRLIGAADVLGRHYQPPPPQKREVPPPDDPPYEDETARVLGAAGG